MLPKMANISQNWLDKGLLDILIVFTYEYNKKRYSGEISKELNIPNRSVSRKLEHAEKQGLIKFVRSGKNKLYYLDLNLKKTFHLILMLESYKALKFAKFYTKTSTLLERFETKLIFGSCAKFQTGSDIDVVFFGKQIVNKDIIHAQYTTKQDFKRQLLKKNTLPIEIAKNHIILSDFEYFVKLFMDYYNE